MEQLTLDLGQVKQEIKEKLQQTAENFVFIGYRLRQILDAGAYAQEGYRDIYAFAKAEFGLGKSAVSRFMAINEKYSSDGYGPELRTEFKGYGSSKLSEMLTLTEEECRLITEQTTISQIREYKQFKKEEPKEEITGQQSFADTEEEPKTEHVLKPLLTEYFRDKTELLRKIIIMDLSTEDMYEEMNLTGNGTFKYKTVFLFMYDLKEGIAYKVFGTPVPERMSWDDLRALIREQMTETDLLELEERERIRQQEEQRQEEEKRRKEEEKRREQDKTGKETAKKKENKEKQEEKKKESVATSQSQEYKKQPAEEDLVKQVDQLPGQDNIMNHPEYLPENMKQDASVDESKMQEDVSENIIDVTLEENRTIETKERQQDGKTEEIKELKADAESEALRLWNMVQGWKDRELIKGEVRKCIEYTENLLILLKDMMDLME